MAPPEKERSMKRIIAEASVQYATGRSVPQQQFASGTDLSTYELWTKKKALPKLIDELGGDARLLWIGPKRLERVVLFLHEGAFLLPASAVLMSFWRYVQLKLEKENLEVGVALLSYSLAPDAVFPTPLKQTGLALDFLLAAGVKPQNLQLAGASAGGNLVVQVLSQMLHPLAGVPEIRLPGPLRGALLISPWVSLSGTSKSHRENDGRDIISRSSLTAMGAQILKDVPATDIAFIEAVRAPESWFDGVGRCVDRVMITAGGAEILRDDIIAFGEAFKRHHEKTELVVQKGGLHVDVLFEALLGEKAAGSVAPLTIEWLAAGFSADPFA
ncbi:Alpha/Beta hydrolase protein [Mycena pura]|uniref:Alpha/Beta hydrolase protein n=1 Tax=Mycena pura TaxID=153505 RepID=A0AAD6V190_9AGAR|nr:Alpha/Beta hydrolase protein [Mycena pura]